MLAEIEQARDEVLESCRKLGVRIDNLLEYARWDFRSSQPESIRQARFKLMLMGARGGPLNCFQLQRRVRY